jgi:hypothetical protein
MITILNPLVYVTVAVCGAAILGWLVIYRREHLADILAFGWWIFSDEQATTPSSPPRYIHGCECETCKSVMAGHVATNVRMAARSFAGPAAKGGSYRDLRREQQLDAIVRGRVQ